MTTYYVSSEIGSDNNAGTSATAPFATLQVAADHTAPGDTVLVMNGTYSNGGNDVLTISTSGTAGAPITFEAAPGATPLIDTQGAWQGVNINANYITFRGFTLVGTAGNYTLAQALAGSTPGDPTFNGNGIGVNLNNNNTPHHHIIIENNTIYNMPGAGIATNAADYLQILNNNVHDNAHWSAYGQSGITIGASVNFDNAPGPHIIVSGNTSVNNAELVPEYRANAITDGEGIILDSNQGYTGGFLVQNNTTSGNSGPGIEANNSDNVVITGNTTTGDLTNPNLVWQGEIFNNQSQNVTITNNNITNIPPPPSPPPGELVVNGGFEASNFSGWSQSGNVGPLSGDPNQPQLFITQAAHTGNNAAGFGSINDDGTISQNLTTVVGQTYTFDFWLANMGGGPNDFTAKIGGVTELHLVSDAAQAYTHYSYTYTATGTSTPLEFDFMQKPSQWRLDDVSVAPASGSSSPPPPAAGAVSINDVTISEGNSGTKVATFTVTRSGGTAAFAVNFATTDGTATVADNDYVAASGTLQFGANENTKTISVTINGDTKVEANETFNVVLSNATNGASISDNQGVGTITNDDSATTPPPAAGSLSINDVTISEGNSGTQVATFTVTRSGGTAAFAVNFATTDGTATVADNDYVAASGTLQFGANENTKTISVTINGDTKVEANETFNVLLSNATNGATVSDSQGVGTITNDDSAATPPPTTSTNLVVNGGFENGDFSGWTRSGNSGGNQIYIAPTAFPGEVHTGSYSAGLGSMNRSDGILTQNIATTAGQHYTLSFWIESDNNGSTPVNHFAAKWNGQTLMSVTDAPNSGYQLYTFDVVGINGNSALEFDGYNNPDAWRLDDVTLIPAGVAPPPASDPVSINDVTISEGNSGTQVATFTVARSGGTAAFDVNFATSDGTATVADNDYVAASGTLQFGANENTKTISVTINGDTKVEANETFNVLLSNATNGATISDSQGVGTITNDDSAATPPPVDTTAPAKPKISSFSPDTSPDGDGHTTATTLTLAGTGEASSTIQVFDGTNSVGTASVDASGTWKITASNLAVGSHSFTAIDTDAAGNTSVKSAPLAVAIDAAPSSPPISGPHNPWGLLTQFMAAQVGSGSGGTTASPPPSTVDSNPITLTSSYGLLH